MGELLGGGYHWQTKAYADGWDAKQAERAADRAHAFQQMLEALPSDRDLPLRILDIGAGDGRVTTVLLDHYPNATAVLIDFSELMMEKGREQLSRFGERYRYVFWDMNDGQWPAGLEGPFDAAVSSVAIHHLVNERKAWLAREVIARLVPGGVFANYDQFRDPNAEFTLEEVHDRTCATVDEAKGFLTDAGYGDIALSAHTPRPLKKCEAALIVGRKPR